MVLPCRKISIVWFWNQNIMFLSDQKRDHYVSKRSEKFLCTIKTLHMVVMNLSCSDSASWYCAVWHHAWCMPCAYICSEPNLQWCPEVKHRKVLPKTFGIHWSFDSEFNFKCCSFLKLLYLFMCSSCWVSPQFKGLKSCGQGLWDRQIKHYEAVK